MNKTINTLLFALIVASGAGVGYFSMLNQKDAASLQVSKAKIESLSTIKDKGAKSGIVLAGIKRDLNVSDTLAELKKQGIESQPKLISSNPVSDLTTPTKAVSQYKYSIDVAVQALTQALIVLKDYNVGISEISISESVATITISITGVENAK